MTAWWKAHTPKGGSRSGTKSSAQLGAGYSKTTALVNQNRGVKRRSAISSNCELVNTKTNKYLNGVYEIVNKMAAIIFSGNTDLNTYLFNTIWCWFHSASLVWNIFYPCDPFLDIYNATCQAGSIDFTYYSISMIYLFIIYLNII